MIYLELFTIVYFGRLCNKFKVLEYHGAIHIAYILCISNTAFHVIKNIHTNGYFSSPDQYRDISLFILLIFPFSIEYCIKSKNNIYLFANILLTTFIAISTNSRSCIYLTLITLIINIKLDFKKLIVALLAILVSLLLFINVVKADDWGHVKQRFKAGLSSPTRVAENLPNGIHEVMKSKILINDHQENVKVNPHNEFIYVSIYFGKLIGGILFLISIIIFITKILKIWNFIITKHILKISGSIIFVNLFAYSMIENYNPYLIFYLTALCFNFKDVNDLYNRIKRAVRKSTISISIYSKNKNK